MPVGKFENIEEMNFEHLEKKPVIYHRGDRDFNAVVAGCDYSLGISIVCPEEKGERDYYMMCLIGPSGKLHLEYHYDTDEYKREFIHTIKMIEEGHIYVPPHEKGFQDDKLADCGFGAPNDDMCSFS